MAPLSSAFVPPLVAPPRLPGTGGTPLLTPARLHVVAAAASPAPANRRVTAMAAGAAPEAAALAQLLSPPPGESPLEAAAAALAISGPQPGDPEADDQPGVAAVVRPPRGDAPASATRSRLVPTGGPRRPMEAAADVPPTPPPLSYTSLTPVGVQSPLMAAAALLTANASRVPQSNVTMGQASDLGAIRSPPTAASPLEAAAGRLVSGESGAPPPGADGKAVAPPVVYPSSLLTDAPKRTLSKHLNPAPALSPIQAAAAVLALKAALDPSGKAGMEAPPRMSELLHPPPNEESPLEQVVAGMFPKPPEPEVVEEEPAPPREPTTLLEALDAPAAKTPLEAAAQVLARSAELDPSGRAAMAPPLDVKALLNAPPANTPLEASARVLARNADWNASRKAATSPPPRVGALLKPKKYEESPLEVMARRLARGEVGDQMPPKGEASASKAPTPPAKEQAAVAGAAQKSGSAASAKASALNTLPGGNDADEEDRGLGARPRDRLRLPARPPLRAARATDKSVPVVPSLSPLTMPAFVTAAVTGTSELAAVGAATDRGAVTASRV